MNNYPNSPLRSNSLKKLLLLIFITCSIGTFGQTKEYKQYQRFREVAASIENDDLPGAVSILKELSEENYSPAISYLGNLYYSGEGVPKNHDKALVLWRRAAAKGSPDACYALGAVYYNGELVSRDFKKAVEYFKCSAKDKNLPSSKDFYPIVGDYLYDNQRHEEAATVYIVLNSEDYEPREGVFEILVEIAEEGNPEAAFKVGEVYMRGSAREKDTEKALHWYKIAADMGHVEAQKEMGRLSSGSQAMEYLKKAAINGDAGAMNSLAENYRDGSNVSKDMAQALYWFKRAYMEGSFSEKDIFEIYRNSGSSQVNWFEFTTDVDGNTFYYYPQSVTRSNYGSVLVYIKIDFKTPEYNSRAEKYFDYLLEGLEFTCGSKAYIRHRYGYSNANKSGEELLGGLSGSYEVDEGSVFKTLQEIICD